MPSSAARDGSGSWTTCKAQLTLQMESTEAELNEMIATDAKKHVEHWKHLLPSLQIAKSCGGLRSKRPELYKISKERGPEICFLRVEIKAAGLSPPSGKQLLP